MRSSKLLACRSQTTALHAVSPPKGWVQSRMICSSRFWLLTCIVQTTVTVESEKGFGVHSIVPYRQTTRRGQPSRYEQCGWMWMAGQLRNIRRGLSLCWMSLLSVSFHTMRYWRKKVRVTGCYGVSRLMGVQGPRCSRRVAGHAFAEFWSYTPVPVGCWWYCPDRCNVPEC